MKKAFSLVLIVGISLAALYLTLPQTAWAGDSMPQVTNNGNIPVLLQVGKQDGGYLLILIPEGQSIKLPSETISVRALPHDLRPARVGQKIELALAKGVNTEMKLGEIGDEVSLRS